MLLALNTFGNSVQGRAAAELGINFIGGYSALVQKGYSNGARVLIDSIPEALAITERVCSSVNVASTKAGINMDAVAQMGHVIKKAAELTADRGSIGCAKLVVFANAPEDNPFMAGAFHGVGEPETVINVGVSGPGVVASAIRRAGDCSLADLAELIKKTAFKITRVGQLVALAARGTFSALPSKSLLCHITPQGAFRPHWRLEGSSEARCPLL